MKTGTAKKRRLAWHRTLKRDTHAFWRKLKDGDREVMEIVKGWLIFGATVFAFVLLHAIAPTAPDGLSVQ